MAIPSCGSSAGPTDAEVRACREKGERLTQEFMANNPIPGKLSSWISEYGNGDMYSNDPLLSPDSSSKAYDTGSVKKHCRELDYYGYAKISGFASIEECEGMIARMAAMIENWDETAPTDSAFATGEAQGKRQAKSDYFLDSADKIHFFTEPDAFENELLDKIDPGAPIRKENEQAEGKNVDLAEPARKTVEPVESAGKNVDPVESGAILKATTSRKRKLKPQLTKQTCLNKVGHGMHVSDEVFRGYSTSAKMQSLVADLGWKNPVIPQSMYIFKQPRIGGEVTSHQDSCFLHTEPRQSCLGLWLALEPATLENGCMWVRPFSHRERLRRCMYRNPEYFEGEKEGAPQMKFRDCVPSEEKEQCCPWEGRMPKGGLKGAASEDPDSLGPLSSTPLFENGFLPIECEAGDLLVFVGTLDHLSLANYSAKSRQTFQLHLVEGPKAGVKWSGSNWLQYRDGNSFMELF